MPRRPHAARFAAEALTIEGALIAPAILARIAGQQDDPKIGVEYRVPKGLTLRDEIPRYFRIGQALFNELNAAAHPSTAKTITFVEQLLRDVFGFVDIAQIGTRSQGERAFSVTLEGLAGRVPVVVVPPEDDLDRASQHLTYENRRHSAASAVQDCLNANDGALWGMCTNGERLRLLRKNASLTRPAYIEADLSLIFEGEAFADFAALWLLIHATRFGAPGAAVTDCPLESWREAGSREGVVARDRLRGGVEAALLALGNGFLSQDATLRERVTKGEVKLQDFFGQLLRLVYRFIFLLAAEDRALLHPPSATAHARKLYAEGYSLASLRDNAVRRTAWDQHHDRWEGLIITFVALARGEKRLGLPALGGLFAPQVIPDLEAARLPNRALMEAIYRLAWLKEDKALVPVNWRDMETEELGSVYEGLLELTPRLTDGGRGFAFAEGEEGKGHARKTSGSYYTPDSLVQALLDSALDPVLDRVETEADDKAAALLGVTVIDPACGSGHFLLAAARRIATRVARARSGGVASAEDYRHALRDVARTCIYAVDRNPMAVELTKVALWIETVDPGKPLGFLDANIRCGDALLGVFDLEALRHGIPDGAYKPLAGDDKETAKHFAKRNRAEKAGQGALDFGRGGGKLPAPPPLDGAARALRALPENSSEEITEKCRRFEAARADPKSWAWRVAADLYVAAFLAPKTGGVPEDRNTVTIPTTAHVWQAISGGQVYGPLVGRAQDLAGAAHAFHWPLEFPEVMAAGGFDAVLGNPPWEVMQLSEEEYFAQRLPEVAELAGAARKRAIAALATDSPAIFATYEVDKRRFEAGNEFARSCRRFGLTARGKVNTFALFAELFANLSSPRGRAGLIIPTGIVNDSTTASFFAALVDGGRVGRVIAFENEEFIFPNVHHSFRFCLLVLRATTDGALPEFSFFLRRVDQIVDLERRFTLSPEDIARINPNTKTAPVFRARADAKLTREIYARIPVLFDEIKGAAGNLWNVEFRQGLFNMTSDSDQFRTAKQLAEAGYEQQASDWILPEVRRAHQTMLDPVGGSRRQSSVLTGRIERHTPSRYVPLCEAKMTWIYDHRASSYHLRGADRGHRVLPPTPIVDHQNSNFDPEPFYWVPTDEVESKLRERSWNLGYLLGWRDITTATAERTMVPCLIPRVGCGDTFLIAFPGEEYRERLFALYANWASLPFDYITRQKITYVHLKYNIVKQLPVLSPSSYTPGDLAFIAPRVLELSFTSHSMASLARDLGYDGPPFEWDESRRARLRADLDAWYAKAYGLTRDELRYILDPADVRGPDYPSETFRVLKTNEIRKYGEYRTARLVLQAWDDQETLRKST